MFHDYQEIVRWSFIYVLRPLVETNYAQFIGDYRFVTAVKEPGVEMLPLG